jgi:hypothetical protein
MVDSTTQALNRMIYSTGTRPPAEEKSEIARHKASLLKAQRRNGRRR